MPAINLCMVCLASTKGALLTLSPFPIMPQKPGCSAVQMEQTYVCITGRFETYEIAKMSLENKNTYLIFRLG